MFLIFQQYHIQQSDIDMGTWLVQSITDTSVKFFRHDEGKEVEHVVYTVGDPAFTITLVRDTPLRF